MPPWTTLTSGYRPVPHLRRIPLSVTGFMATRKPRPFHTAHRLPSRPNCTRSTNSEKHQESNFPQRLGPIEKYPRLPRCERSRRGIARRASEPPLWRATCPGYVPHADEQQRAFPSVDLRDGRLFIGLNLHGRSMPADCYCSACRPQACERPQTVIQTLLVILCRQKIF